MHVWILKLYSIFYIIDKNSNEILLVNLIE